MANYDRGVYEPSEEVRVFDGSEEEEDVEGSRLPLLIVLALLVLAMFAGVVWLAYTQGVARGRGETPVLTAPKPARRGSRRQNAGGGAVPYQGFKIYEQPAPPDDERRQPRPPAAGVSAARASAARRKPAASARGASAGCARQGAAPRQAAAAAPAAPSQRQPKPVAALIQQAKPAPGRRSRASKSPPPAMKPALAPPRRPATGAHRGSCSAAATAPACCRPPAPAAPAARLPQPAARYVLQIGAYKSPGRCRCRLEDLQGQACRAAVGLFRRMSSRPIWATRASGIACASPASPSKDVASALCDRLKADGGGCFLGK